MTRNEVFVPVPNIYLITAKLIFLLSKKEEGASPPPLPGVAGPEENGTKEQSYA